MEYLFLSYAHEDQDAVSEVYRALREATLNPWMDTPPDPWRAEGIPVGTDWESYVKAKIEGAKLVLVFLSAVSVAKIGYVQHEYKYALKCMESRPPGRSFLCPIRLDKCEIPDIRVETTHLRDLQWLDLFTHGVGGLVASISSLLGKPGPDRPPYTELLRMVLENEASRFTAQLAKKDEEIADLREDLARSARSAPPVEAFNDPFFMQWWLEHRYDE
jgi:hypothetical protein